MSKYSKPKLIDDQTVEHVNNKIQSQNYTDTNMLPELFANEEKLISSDRRHYYGDNDDEENDNYNLDEEISNYKQSNSHINHQKVFQSVHESEKESDREEKNTYSEKKQNKEPSSETTSNTDKEIEPEDESNWTKEELLLRKLDMLRKLGELAQCGVKLSQNYSINSDYKTMKFEYELHTGIRSKQNAVNWMSGMMIGIVKGMELLNDNFNPFDIKFENTWSNKVTSDITDYYDILGEIYEKYTTPGKKMAPELKLFLMLTGSAISIQMHKGISGLIPTVSNNLDNDPELINKLRKEAENENKAAEERRNKINERMDKEHRLAAERAADLQMINVKHAEYQNLQKMANDKTMEKFNNTLLLSESARSIQKPIYRNSHSSADSDGSKKNNNIATDTFIKHQLEQQRQRELTEQNKKLMAMQKMLKGMRDEEELVGKSDSHKSVSSRNKKIAKKTESSESESENDISTTASSASTMSVNPNLDAILGKHSNKKNTEEQIIPIKIMSKEDAENEITFESISFGKKSSKSNDSGSANKRGRPKKTMKIKIGK